MTIPETVLTFVGIPLGIILVLFVAVYGRSLTHQPNRYRPGKPWPYEAAWFVPHPDAVAPGSAHTRPTSTSGVTTTTAVGGASGEW